MISLDNLTVSYGGWTLFDNISLLINPKDRIGLVGKNGAGKTTLLRLIVGEQQPTSGSISYNGECTIGYLPQQTSAQRDFPATVSEVVLSGFANKRGLHFFYSAAEKSAALMNMGKLGVLELQNRCYRELSGGQQQRVLLARALCAANDLLILDEPVTGLDPASMQDLYKTLRYLNEREGMAIIMVTHDIENALREAKHILCVDRAGCFYGTVDEFLSSPAGKRFGGERA